jgi:diguanylate cyclase (GGDEF)-like protein
MTALPRFWQKLNLGIRIASLTSLVVLLTVAAVTYLLIQREKQHFENEMITQANLLTETIPLTLRDQLYRMELDEITDIARVVSNNENITMFVVYGRQGSNLVDSSKPNMVLSLTTDPLGEMLVAYQKDQVHLDWQDDQLVVGRPILIGNQTLGAVAIGLSTAPLDQKIQELTLQSISIAGMTLVVGIGLSYMLAKQITNPIIALARVAAKMAEGKLDTRAVAHDGNEIGHLGMVFNTLAKSIQQRERELRDFAVGLEHEVAERTSELRQQNEILVQMAITDPLTKIYNRRHFFELAEKEMERAKRFGHPTSAILIDADHFKEVNDTYGHMVGDQVLINLANFLKENIRTIDIFARYGGEEFAILMPETDSNAAITSADRLRQFVGQTPMTKGGIDVHVTISMGIASWDGGSDITLDSLLGHADFALYQAKEAGRNRVTVWQEM